MTIKSKQSQCLIVFDDCQPSHAWSSRNQAVETMLRDIGRDMRRGIVCPRPQWIALPTPSEAELIAIQLRRQKAERATFFLAQLGQRVPVRDLLAHIGSFYTDGITIAKQRGACVTANQSERIAMYELASNIVLRTQAQYKES